MERKEIILIVIGVIVLLLCPVACNNIGYCTDEYYAGAFHNRCTIPGGTCYDCAVLNGCTYCGSKYSRPEEGVNYTDLKGEVYDKSYGDGKNGYVTVRMTINHMPENGSIIDMLVKYEVYDGEVLVGTAYETLKGLGERIGDNIYAHYANVAITEYINGDYTVKITCLAGNVSKKVG